MVRGRVWLRQTLMAGTPGSATEMHSGWALNHRWTGPGQEYLGFVFQQERSGSAHSTLQLVALSGQDGPWEGSATEATQVAAQPPHFL